MTRLALFLLLVAGCQNDARYVAMDAVALPAGARVVTPASPPAAGPATRVQTEACVPGSGGLQVADAVKASLAPDWPNARVLPSGDRWVVVGTNAKMSLSATVDPARKAPCADGELYVNIGVADLASPPAAEATAKVVGPAGARSAAATRPHVPMTKVQQ